MLKKVGKTNDKVAIIDATGVLDTALTGVVAIKVSEELNLPVLMLQRRSDDKTEYGGSGRAFDNCPIDDFRALIEECPYTTFAQGHNSAFGTSIPVKNIDLVRQWLNERLDGVSMEKVYDVDFEIDADELDAHMFQTLDYYKSLWGHGVQEPKFAIKNLHISTDNARICGKKQDTIQIYDEVADVKYVMFFCAKDNQLLQWLSNNWGDQEADITVIGTLGLSMYEGRLDSQVVIKDVQIFNTIQN